VKKAKAVMSRPMNLDVIKARLEDTLKVPVTAGTHDF